MPKNKNKAQSQKGKKSKVISKGTKLLFILSFALFAFFFVHKIQQLTSPSFSYTPTTQVSTAIRNARPTRIIIESQHIDIPVEESAIVHGDWQVNPDGASHLDISGNPGENTNTVIYGHNLLRIFGKIRNLKRGDIIFVETQSNKGYKYVVSETKIVSPNEISVVQPTKEEILTLFTCDGFADTKRFVVRAKLL